MPVSRLGDLAAAVGARLSGDPDIEISGVGTLQNARQGEISFLSNQKYRRYLKDTQASAVILGADDEALDKLDIELTDETTDELEALELTLETLETLEAVKDDELDDATISGSLYAILSNEASCCCVLISND